ncbi:adenosylcobinamide-phosphate synthase CbiB [Aquipuribacter sp. MA13-6]|uniref:adenosylcobinamide-phosphate synthase CbiB n=1 Tax=unclassified Aquipuribacter TaxID=2635084 RepID=UPI003EEC0211
MSAGGVRSTGAGGTGTGWSVRPVALVVALVLDQVLGEPPTRWHPVVAMGTYLDRAASRVPAAPPLPASLIGGATVGLGVVACAATGALLDRCSRRLPWPGAVAVQAAVLWTLLSARLLHDEVAAVEQALARSTGHGRDRVSRLVSRDTATLDAEQVRGAALGSLSENLSDSVVAPALAHAVGGLGAAAAYRFVNTADAMWGYRTPRWQHAGWVAARADDAANLLPARLTGLLLAGPDPRLLARLPREAARTPSPNGGWPMGALALRLGVRMHKPGVYALNPHARAAGPDDTAAALRLFRLTTVRAAVLLGASAGLVQLARTRLDRTRLDRTLPARTLPARTCA